MRVSSIAVSTLVSYCYFSLWSSPIPSTFAFAGLTPTTNNNNNNSCVNTQNKKKHLTNNPTFVATTTKRSMTSTVTNEAEETAAAAPVEYFRKDYKPLSHTVSNVELSFDIHPGTTTVTSKLTVIPNKLEGEKEDFYLNGDSTCLTLKSLSLNGKALVEGIDYTVDEKKNILSIPAIADSGDDSFTIEVVVDIVPEDNSQLSGLYKSNTMYCTQCEAMGFRRITYYPDRPDIMAVFSKVTVEAPAKEYPILLSNGNLLGSGTATSAEDRHYAIWSDPFPKPSYLFALVAGDLGYITDSYTTTSGKNVELNIYSEPQNVHKLQHAMQSVKDSMKWDEDTFGLEYDLNLYNIVAVNDFNMGAMENKGLNVFNTAYVLADPKTATDVDYERIQGVIGHEYFHNWTGNRVTCRDWFQLTLKEGLTVYRDQQFSGDLNSNIVNRIDNVSSLRGRQFAEDAGPMSHPIRPDSYISMDNFYTATVYSKGAEVIRMYHTILGGDEAFRKGMDLYFERHDGQAVTCDDFCSAMSAANDNYDLDQFSLWYSTPGTPTVSYDYAVNDGKFELTLAQTTSTGTALHIPVSVGILNRETGEEIVPTQVLQLKELTQTFTFDVDGDDLVPSVLRNFSAPVKLVSKKSLEQQDEDLAFLAAHDTDGFNKWEAGQKLYTTTIFQTMEDKLSDKTSTFVKTAFQNTLASTDLDDAIKAYALTLPSETSLAEEIGTNVDPIAIHNARGAIKKKLAREFYSEILAQYEELTKSMAADEEFKVDATSIGRRRLRNTLLDYLCSIKETSEELETAASLAWKHYEGASGMSDKMSALNALASMDNSPLSEKALQTFYDEAEGDALVLNKWFTVQALADVPNILEKVKALTAHPDFTMENPNRCRALLSAFSMNTAGFHGEGGYEFIAEKIAQVDALNPQISSRMAASSLIGWKKLTSERGSSMKEQLAKLSEKKLSSDLYEIVSRGLK